MPARTGNEVPQYEIDNARESLEKLGYGPNPFCKVCGGYGKLHPLKANDELDYSQIVDCPERNCLGESFQQYQRGQRAMIVHGLTSYLFNFETFKPLKDTEAAFQAFVELAEGRTDKPFLLCIGGVGCGKSHLCEALTLKLNQRGINAWYYPVAALMGHIKASIANNGTQAWIDSLSGMAALILDDFGVEQGTEFEMATLERIIDERYRWHRITVLTSNKAIAQLKLTSPRILSRFSDAELSTVVVNAAGDYRRSK